MREPAGLHVPLGHLDHDGAHAQVAVAGAHDPAMRTLLPSANSTSPFFLPIRAPVDAGLRGFLVHRHHLGSAGAELAAMLRGNLWAVAICTFTVAPDAPARNRNHLRVDDFNAAIVAHVLLLLFAGTRVRRGARRT